MQPKSARRAELLTADRPWTVVHSPNVGSGDNVLASVAGADAHDVWAVGQVAPDSDPNITLTLALHYDGSAWSVVDTPNRGAQANALLAVAAQPGAAWAVGYHIGQDFLAHSLIERWNGHAWHLSQAPRVHETENLYAVASTSPSDVWAVGSGRDDEGPFSAIALHFDGDSWTAIPTANPGTTGNVLYGLVALAENDVWAVGQQIRDSSPTTR